MRGVSSHHLCHYQYPSLARPIVISPFDPRLAATSHETTASVTQATYPSQIKLNAQHVQYSTVLTTASLSAKKSKFYYTYDSCGLVNSKQCYEFLFRAPPPCDPHNHNPTSLHRNLRVGLRPLRASPGTPPSTILHSPFSPS